MFALFSFYNNNEKLEIYLHATKQLYTTYSGLCMPQTMDLFMKTGIRSNYTLNI